METKEAEKQATNCSPKTPQIEGKSKNESDIKEGNSTEKLDYKELYFSQPSQKDKVKKDFSEYTKVDMTMLNKKRERENPEKLEDSKDIDEKENKENKNEKKTEKEKKEEKNDSKILKNEPNIEGEKTDKEEKEKKDGVAKDIEEKKDSKDKGNKNETKEKEEKKESKDSPKECKDQGYISKPLPTEIQDLIEKVKKQGPITKETFEKYKTQKKLNLSY